MLKNDLIFIFIGTFSCKCEEAGIYEESLIIMERERVTLRTIQGTVKQILFLVATEGNPIVLGLHKNFTTVVTSQGFLKVWDVSRRFVFNRPIKKKYIISSYIFIILYY